MSERESDYSVYLVQRHGAQGGKREVTSPVTGHRLEFYDTGVWLDRATGRNFFPYEQIRTIREHPEGQAPESRASALGESESDAPDRDRTEGQSPEEGDRGAGEGDRGAGESDPQTGEGDSGAEEEMLEE